MIIRKRALALTAALCGVIGLAATQMTGTDSAGTDVSKPFVGRSPSQTAEELSDASQVEATRMVVASADVTTIAELATPATPVATDTTPSADDLIVVAALTPPNVASTSLTVPAETETAIVPAPKDEKPDTVELLDECFVLESCVDHYLWELYQRTAKLDTNKVHERRKVKVRKKGKIVTVTKRVTKLVNQDFTWKDPHAAEKARMSMMDYVIGGMDRDFKLKLFQGLRAAEKEGLAPGITSGFRDDYRQSIASGLKAASNRSYHGGSLRGGYGHGVAADVVSTKGATRAQRWVTTEMLWKWIDANGQQFGIGRPYLDRDPPHVTPIDGEEYVSRRGTKVQVAKSEIKKPVQVTAQRSKAAPTVKKPQVAQVAQVAARSAKANVSSGRSKQAAVKRN